MSQIEIKCEKPSCQNTVKVSADTFFWSTRTGYEVYEVQLRCPECSRFANAPMIKPQPKSQKIDGWDV